MANHARNNRAFKTAANFTGKAATSTFKCATTDHLDMSRVFLDMPSMGFLSTLKWSSPFPLESTVGLARCCSRSAPAGGGSRWGKQ